MADDSLALQDIKKPNEHDILCGRFKTSYNHSGNDTYRELVNMNKPLYSTLEVTQKIKLSKSIVSAIRSQDPPGRFLALNKKTELYYDIGNKKAIEKVSQALREGQQKTKQKMTKIAESNQNNMYFTPQHPIQMVGQNQPMMNLGPNQPPQMINVAAQNNHHQAMNMPMPNQPHPMNMSPMQYSQMMNAHMYQQTMQQQTMQQQTMQQQSMQQQPMQQQPMQQQPMQQQPMQQQPMQLHPMQQQQLQPQQMKMNQIMDTTQNTSTKRMMNPQMRTIHSFADSVETLKNSNVNNLEQTQSMNIPTTIDQKDSGNSNPPDSFVSSGGAMTSDRESMSMGTFPASDPNSSFTTSSLGFSSDFDVSNRKFRLSELTSSITTKLSMDDDLLDEELLNYEHDNAETSEDVEMECDEKFNDMIESPATRRRSSNSFKLAFEQFRSSFASFFSRGQSVSSSRLRMSNISNITGATEYSTSKDPYT